MVVPPTGSARVVQLWLLPLVLETLLGSATLRGSASAKVSVSPLGLVMAQASR